MSKIVRFIAESSSDESSIEDKYDATSFGSQFDSDTSSDIDPEIYKNGYSFESDQDSHISLSPGEEYVLDTLFGWMDRPICTAPAERQSLLLESAKASALQNIKVNRQLYLTNHAENLDSHSDSDSDSFITQEAEEYSEDPEQSYSEAQDDVPVHSKFAEEEEDRHEEDDQESQMEDEEVLKKSEKSKQRKYSGQKQNVVPSKAMPLRTEDLGIQGIDQFHSESQENESDSEGMVEVPTGSEDDTSAVHRVSFLNTVLKKKERKVEDEEGPSNIFEPPSKKISRAARKQVPSQVKISRNKVVRVPADVRVVSSSKHARREPAEEPEEMLAEDAIEVPLEVSVASRTETVTDVPAEIKTTLKKSKKTRGRSPSRVKKSRPSPINTNEMAELEVEKSPSLEFLAAKIAQQQNTPRNRSNRDPTPTRRDARSRAEPEEEKEVKPHKQHEAQDQQVHEVDDPTASREPPVGYSPRSPHDVNKIKDYEQVREPTRNSRLDPAEGSEPVVRSQTSNLKEEAVVTKAKKVTRPTRSKRLSSTKKSKRKKKVPDVHPGRPQQGDEIEHSTLQNSRPFQSVTVDELKQTLSELSQPHPQQIESRDNEESKHNKVDLAGEDQKRENFSNGKNQPMMQSTEEGQALRKTDRRSVPVTHHSPSNRHIETSRATQNVIQYGDLPTNNQDNPIDIEEYMAQREMLNREAPRMDFSGTSTNKTKEPHRPREQVESPRQPPSPSYLRPEVALEEHGGAADLPTVANSPTHGKHSKQRNYYFRNAKESSRQSKRHSNFGIRQPKQFDALARNDPAGHVTNHEYKTKKKSKKSSSGKSKSHLASIEDLKQLEKRIEEHFRNSYAVDNDNRSAVSTKELRKLERQLVLQLRRVEEKRAAKLERLRNKKKGDRRQRDIVEAEVIAVEPKEEGMQHHFSLRNKLDAKKKSSDFRDANRYEQLQALRLSKEMGRYMSKQSGHAANPRYQGQAY